MLDSPHSSEIKEQALCVIGHIAAGAGITDYIMENERTLKKLFEFIVCDYYLNCHSAAKHSFNHFGILQSHKDGKLQEGAMFAIKNLIDKSDLNTPQRLSRLREMGIIDKLEYYLSTTRESSRSSDE